MCVSNMHAFIRIIFMFENSIFKFNSMYHSHLLPTGKCNPVPASKDSCFILHESKISNKPSTHPRFNDYQHVDFICRLDSNKAILIKHMHGFEKYSLQNPSFTTSHFLKIIFSLMTKTDWAIYMVLNTCKQSNNSRMINRIPTF